MDLRRIADADVGAALAGQRQRKGRLAGGDGQREHQFVAEDLDLAEGVVLLGLAVRQAGLAEADAVGVELEAVAVEVVAVGDAEADLDGLVVDGTGAGAEGLLDRQRLGGGTDADGCQQQRDEGEQGEEMSEVAVHGREAWRKGRTAASDWIKS